MEKQIKFIEVLYADLIKNTKRYAKATESNKSGYYHPEVFMNKNCGKSVLKKKIIFLRQELMNLAIMLDNE